MYWQNYEWIFQGQAASILYNAFFRNTCILVVLKATNYLHLLASL